MNVYYCIKTLSWSVCATPLKISHNVQLYSANLTTAHYIRQPLPAGFQGIKKKKTGYISGHDFGLKSDRTCSSPISYVTQALLRENFHDHFTNM